MKIFAETERLILREVLESDVEGFFELDSDPEVHRYLGNQPLTTKEQANDVITNIRQQYIDNGIGRWAAVDKQTNTFIGWTGLKLVTQTINDHVNYLDLGYRLLRKYWGKGLATETAFASLAYAFENLNAAEVYAMADCDNEGSNKVLKKAGLKCIETFQLNGTSHKWYKITKAEFTNSKTTSSLV